MLDKGRFTLEGVRFSWWVDEQLVLTVSSSFGCKQRQIEPGANREMAAQQLAMRCFLDAENPIKQ